MGIERIEETAVRGLQFIHEGQCFLILASCVSREQDNVVEQSGF